ncbi:MAG: protein kinase, partial [Ktedonobacteraceae bacterium]|nr:protein kinase [Ktedonobacteraceae bacterium]
MKLWRYGCAIERLGNRYRLEGMLGSGGNADVCLALDEQTQREVAIKVIRQDALDQRTLDRFLLEADQVAGWQHPNILHTYGGLKLELLDIAHGSIVPYIVMEYAQGGDLRRRLRPGMPYPLAESLRIFEQLCIAVSYAHERRIVHRDLKPHNILFRRLPDGSEQVALSDFGLAVELDASHISVTRAGTLAYMAPEQLRGHVLPASDIFALGVIFYQLCTGHLPFRRLPDDLRIPPPFTLPPLASTRNPFLPTTLDDVIFTALAEQPADRFPTAAHLWDAIQAALPDDSTSLMRRRRRLHRSPSRQSQSRTPGAAAPAHTAHMRDAIPEQQQDLLENAAYTGKTGNTTSYLHLDTPAAMPAITTPFPTPDKDEGDGRQDQDERPGPRPHLLGASPTAIQPSNMSHVGIPLAGIHSPHKTRSSPGRGVRWRVRVVAALLVVMVVGSSVLFYFNVYNVRVLLPLPILSGGTVTITPSYKDISNNYVIQAVPGQANPDQLQVTARHLSAKQSQQRSVPASGHNQQPAKNAVGKLTFYNGSFTQPFTVAAGTVLTGKDGVQVTTNVDVTIPTAKTETGTQGSAVVSAHAVNAGAKGNIPALDINAVCCTSGNFIFARNQEPFTGGQDAKDYSFVKQDDYDNAVSALSQQLTQQANAELTKQLRPGEQLAAGGTALCPADVTKDKAVGDQGINVEAVNVAVM